MNWDSSTSTSLYDSGTNLGQGTGTAPAIFRNDVINVNDQELEEGDWIFLLPEVTQGTGQSCQFYSLSVTYTIA